MASAAAVKKVLVPITAGSEPVEASVPIDVLRRAGAHVTVAAAAAGAGGLLVEAMYGVKIVADANVADCADASYDLVVLAGGLPGAENLGGCAELESIVRRHALKGGLYAAICAAPPLALARWGLLNGVKATAHPAFVDKFPAEVTAVDANVVVDGKVVTSRGPATATEFAFALVEQLYGKDKVDQIAKPMLVRYEPGYTIKELNPVQWQCSGTPKVLIPLANASEEMEVVTIIDVLRRANADVVVASAEDGLEVAARYGMRIVADVTLDAADGQQFDLIIVPGGVPGATTLGGKEELVGLLKRQAEAKRPYGAIGAATAQVLEPHGLLKGGMPGSVNLRDCKVLEKMVKKHADNGGLYGAICAAPAVTLAYWGMLKGLKATCYPSFMDKFAADIIPVTSRVVVDRNAVTSQGPGTAIEFALALVEKLYGKEKMEEVAGPLYVRPQHGAEYTIEELNSIEWKCSSTPQILVPVANGSEEMEAFNLIDVLRRAGANVTVASVEEKLQIVTRRHKFNVIADMMLDEAAEMQFDLIVMPGGLQGAQKFASTKKLVGLLKKQAESNKPYGAICASPAHVLEPHGLLKGKKATAFPPMSHLLTDQSACDHRVVVDGNLITSRAPGTATEFALAIVEKLFGRDKAVSIAKELIFM